MNIQLCTITLSFDVRDNISDKEADELLDQIEAMLKPELEAYAVEWLEDREGDARVHVE